MHALKYALLGMLLNIYISATDQRITQLGSDSWEVRQKATKSILLEGKAARLKAGFAMLWDDAEVQARGRLIANQLAPAVRVEWYNPPPQFVYYDYITNHFPNIKHDIIQGPDDGSGVRGTKVYWDDVLVYSDTGEMWDRVDSNPNDPATIFLFYPTY